MPSLNHLISVALQGPESLAASKLQSPAFLLREVKVLWQDLFPSWPLLLTVVPYGRAALYLTAPARASLGAISNQNPMLLWRNAEVEP